MWGAVPWRCRGQLATGITLTRDLEPSCWSLTFALGSILRLMSLRMVRVLFQKQLDSFRQAFSNKELLRAATCSLRGINWTLKRMTET